MICLHQPLYSVNLELSIVPDAREYLHEVEPKEEALVNLMMSCGLNGHENEHCQKKWEPADGKQKSCTSLPLLGEQGASDVPDDVKPSPPSDKPCCSHDKRPSWIQ